MSISSALNSALSGLTAASRASAIVSDNIANALTPGYARRSLELAGNVVNGTGVRVVAVTRHTDPVLVANRRGADAALGHADTIAQFHDGLTRLIGGVDDPASIPNLMAEFESSLIAASSNPGSQVRLDAAVGAARNVAQALNRASNGVRDARIGADRSIAQQVDRLNIVLKDIEELNSRVQTMRLSGGDTAALLDQRQRLIDEVNGIVPVNVVGRDHGSVALFTDGGAILLDGAAGQFSFTQTPQAMPHMTVENGLLSGLHLNGVELRVGGETSVIRGGTLAASFDVRDSLAVDAQQNLDAVARDLIERFEAPGLDATLAPGDPGLFTDNGGRFAATDQIGLAGRLHLNATVDPARGGQSWRLRDGLGAAAPGSTGDASLIKAFHGALTTARPTGDTRFGTGDMTSADISAALLSVTSQTASIATEQLTFAASSQSELHRIELEQGVDTDAELQTLMRVEQAYAANARVIETVSELMDTLLRL